jgi:hypothetical protein
MGCAPPYFDALNAAAGLTRQMTNVGTIGAVSMDSNVSDVRFLPPRSTAATIADMNIQSGFVLHTQGAYQHLQFVFPGSSGFAQSTGSDPLQLTSTDPNLPRYEYLVTTSAGNPAVIVILYDTTVSTYKVDVADPIAMTMTNGAVNQFTTLFASQYPIGAALLPSPAPGPDSVVFLMSNAGTLSEGPATLNGTVTGLTSGGIQGLATAPVPAMAQSRSLAFYNPTTAQGYASYLVSGSWQTVSYTSTGSPTLLPGVTHPLMAVLTTGDLLSTDGGVLRLYDPGGNLLRSLALNGLQYCYEAYVGSTAYVFFSLPMVNTHRDWSFNVYAIPTTSMRSLGG